MSQNRKHVTPMIVLLIPLMLAALLAWSSRPAAAQAGARAPQAAYVAHLSGANEVPPVDTPASGTATFVLDSDGSTLHYRVQVSDISGISMAHIHQAPAGANGGVIHGLYAGVGTFDPDNPISGSVTLTAEQVTALNAGNLYVNVHTATYPAGEIRGQIGAYDTPAVMGALMSGDQEVPANASAATGVARFDKTGVNTYSYELAVNDLEGTVSNAHIHIGREGVGGGVVLPLNFSGLAPNVSTGGMITFTQSSQLLDFLTGFHYVNIHSTVYPGGEIRGNVYPTGVLPYSADLAGTNEVPPVATTAGGDGTLVVDSDWQSAYYLVSVSDISNISMAHIHEAPAGVNGGVTVGLFNGSGAFNNTHPISGTLTFNINNLADLVTERFYINVHTTAHPAGEIRGQLVSHALGDMVAVLSGANEIPPVATARTGLATFSFVDSETVDYSIDLSDLANVTAAHIHRAWVTRNGPVVFPLYPSARATLTSGTLTLTAAQLRDMLGGNYYVNVHTTTNPGGEVRGQVVPQGAPTSVTLLGQSGQPLAMFNSGGAALLLMVLVVATWLLLRRRAW